MPYKAYSIIYLHATWHTAKNAPLLAGRAAEIVRTVIAKKRDAEREVQVLAIGGTENHICYVKRQREQHASLRLSAELERTE